MTRKGGGVTIGYPLTAVQRQMGCFSFFMMTVDLNKPDSKCKYRHMTGRDCVKHPLVANRIDSSIDTQMLKDLNVILFHLVNLDNGKNLDIGTPKKDRGYIFS